MKGTGTEPPTWLPLVTGCTSQLDGTVSAIPPLLEGCIRSWSSSLLACSMRSSRGDTSGMHQAYQDLATLHTTRRIASEALAETLRAGLGASEAALAEAWVAAMHTAGVPWFWYTPPPDGTSVLSGSELERLALTSFRPPSAWPSDRATTEIAPLTCYTSPVSKDGLIGDFGLTLYAGPDPAIRAHIAQVAELVAGVTDAAEVGINFCDLYAHAERCWVAAGLTNDIASTTDRAGTNIGHTIPFFGEDRRHVPKGGDAARTLSEARSFVSAVSTEVLGETCAFTIEPRLGAPGLPVSWFHVVVVFVEGTKHVVTEFTPVLDALGCVWFGDPWA